MLRDLAHAESIALSIDQRVSSAERAGVAPVRCGVNIELLLAAVALLTGAVGCAPRGGITLHQTFAPSGQRELTLQNSRSHASSSPDARTIVATFSRPDAETASRDFVLYLVTPPNEGEWVVDAGSTFAARGFLIQTAGSLRGKTLLTGGSAIVRRAAWPRTNEYLVELALRCADETRIVGALRAKEAPYDALLVERRYAADVIELTGREVGDQSDPLPEPTPPRATAWR